MESAILPYVDSLFGLLHPLGTWFEQGVKGDDKAGTATRALSYLSIINIIITNMPFFSEEGSSENPEIILD